MSKNRPLSWAAGVGAAGLVTLLGAMGFAFTQVDSVTLSAVAAVGAAPPAAGVTTFSVPRLLPGQAFFGKDVVLPMEIASGGTGVPAVDVASGTPGGTFRAAIPFGSFAPSLGNTNSQNVTLVYQLLDRSRNPLGSPATLPIGFQTTGIPGQFIADAVVPLQNLQQLRRGGILSYYFQIQNGSTLIQVRNAGVPFEVEFTNEMVFPVNPLGSLAVIPDTNILDGKTSIAFAPGALSLIGNLRVRLLEPNEVPTGPGGLAPIVAYNFNLEGTLLVRDALITLTYPARFDGSIIGSNGNPADLAPYHLEGAEWTVLGPRTWNSRMHTVSAVSPRFSTFALFLSAATSPADLRPRRRVLTPNGDGINDTIDFSGIATDGVHIFDMNGRRVRDLQSFNLIWDGRDDEGRIVESGLYLYQYSSQGERVSGVILIAK